MRRRWSKLRESIRRQAPRTCVWFWWAKCRCGRRQEPAERQLLLVGYRLLRKHEDAVTAERCVDLGKDLGHHRAGEVDAAHLGAKRRMKRASSIA